MKRLLIQILLAAVTVASARAQSTPLTIGPASAENCWTEIIASSPPPPVMMNSFTLPSASVTGSGTVISSAIRALYIDPAGNQTFYWVYGYGLDLSGMSADTTNCISLQIPFGADVQCASDVLQATGSGTVAVSSASQDGSGDDTFLFGSGCLKPGQTTMPFQLVSLPGTPLGNNYVTVVDTYLDPATGQPVTTTALVAAYVPQIPHLIPPPQGSAPCTNCSPMPLPPFSFQGVLQTNCPICLNPQPLPPGRWDMTFTLMDAESNSFPVSTTVTETVQVGPGGEFTTCLPQQPAFLSGGPTWLSIGIRPSGSSDPYAQLSPPLPVKSIPQAYYALGAGTAASINPGVAVTSINGRSDSILFRAGLNMAILQTNNTFTFNAGAAGSDRNIKTDVEPVKPVDILSKLLSMPIESWRYTNDMAAIRHLGPMAQDFKAAFKLGDDERIIELMDEGGVALAAIQGLSQKVDQRVKQLEEDLKCRDAENAELKSELSELRQLLLKLTAKSVR